MANGDDYWSPQAKQRRDAERHAAAVKLAREQQNSNEAPFRAIGSFLGDAGRNIGNFLNDANNNARDANRERLERKGNAQPRFEMPARAQQPQQQFGGNPGSNPNYIDEMRDKAMAGRERFSPNQRQEGDGEMSPIDKILERLGQRFSYEGGSEDTSALDSLLSNKMAEINGLKGQAQGNFATSDKNVADMHSAFQNEVRGQQAGIQAQGDKTSADIGGIFNKTIDSNNARQAEQQASKMEMLQRLGIAPAANAPDLQGEEIARGNNNAQQARDVRQSESAINTQTNINRNTGLASAIGNDGLQRRSDLNSRLQEVLGQLTSKEADVQTDYQKSRMELQNSGEDRAYDRWLQDRQFDMGLFNSYNGANEKLAEANAKGLEAESKSTGLTGIRGLNANSNPDVVNAVVALSKQVDIANDPQKAMQLLSDKKFGLNQTELFNYITEYGKLSNTNKYADPNAE